jgi:hypothetical protein
LDCGEVLYDPNTRVLMASGAVYRKKVDRIRGSLKIENDARLLFDDAVRPGLFKLTAQDPRIEEEVPETSWQRLRAIVAIVEALDSEGTPLEKQEMRLNVGFDNAIEVIRGVFSPPELLARQDANAAVDDLRTTDRSARQGNCASQSGSCGRAESANEASEVARCVFPQCASWTR